MEGVVPHKSVRDLVLPHSRGGGGLTGLIGLDLVGFRGGWFLVWGVSVAGLAGWFSSFQTISHCRAQSRAAALELWANMRAILEEARGGG